MKLHSIIAGMLLTVVVPISGCAQPGSTGQSPPTADASGEVLSRTFGACPDGEKREGGGIEALADLATNWVRMTGVETAQRTTDPDGRTIPSTVITSEGKTRQVDLHVSYWPGIDWTLSVGGEVWLAMADPDRFAGENPVGYVMAISPSNEVFFPGTCLDMLFFQPLRQRFGDTTNSTLRMVPGRSAAEIRDALGLKTVKDRDEVVILNPETTDESILKALQFAMVQMSMDKALGTEYTICTRSTAGWNDCISTADAAAPLAVGGYFAEDGLVEVWLLDADADLRAPIKLLGSFLIPAQVRGTDGIALSIAVRTSSALNEGPSAPLVTLLAAKRLDDIDPDDPAWAGLSGGTAAR